MKGGEDLPSGAIDALVGRSFNLSNARLSTYRPLHSRHWLIVIYRALQLLTQGGTRSGYCRHLDNTGTESLVKQRGGCLTMSSS